MKYDEYRDLKPPERPVKLPAVWHSSNLRGSRLFLLLTIVGCIVVNAILKINMKGWSIEVIGISIIALAFGLGFWLSMGSGVSSSSGGTYFRDKEPYRFWRDNFIILGFVCFFMAALWI